MNTQNWEAEFDKKFPYIDGNGSFGELNDVKDFIRKVEQSTYLKAAEYVKSLKCDKKYYFSDLKRNLKDAMNELADGIANHLTSLGISSDKKE